MRKASSYFLVAGFLLGVNIDVWAIAVQDLPTSESAPTNSGYTFNWAYTYKYNGSSSVAIDHYWILTAGHVKAASGTISVNGETYTQVTAVSHSQAADPDGNPSADLALIKFDKPLPGYYPLYNGIPLATEVMIVGFGFPGNVERSKFSGYFTEDGSGARIRRWGSNKIDSLYTNGNSLGFLATISGTAGSQGGTDYEAGCNDKDSGSGVFYNDGGIWKLVGTVAGRFEDGSNPGQYLGNFAVATSHYINWIKSVVVDYDTDMDGLPDWWETLYGGDATSMIATNDLDSDHFSNYEEWIADTVPVDGSSYFHTGVYTNVTSLEFASSTNRKYQIQYRLNLADTNETWQTEVDWFTPTGSPTAQPVSSSTSNRYYRIGVKLR